MKAGKTVLLAAGLVALLAVCEAGTPSQELQPLGDGAMQNIVALKSDASDAEANYLRAGQYTLKYGLYKGRVIEHDWDDEKQKPIKRVANEITLRLNADGTYELDGQKHEYIVADERFLVPYYNNSVVFRAMGNNKINLEVGAGVILTYRKK